MRDRFQSITSEDDEEHGRTIGHPLVGRTGVRAPLCCTSFAASAEQTLDDSPKTLDEQSDGGHCRRRTPGVPVESTAAVVLSKARQLADGCARAVGAAVLPAGDGSD